MLLSCVQYLTEIQGFDMRSSGGIAALPYVLLFLCTVGAGRLADWLIQHHLSVRATRVLLQAIAFLGSGISMSITGFMPSTGLAVSCIVFSIVITGFSQAAIGVNYVDLSPHYPGVFFSIGNTISNIAGMVSPLVAGRILTSGESHARRVEEWQEVFYISTAVLLGALMLWAGLCRGKAQASLN